MTMNRVQFQPGLSLADFLDQYGTEAACVAMVPPGRPCGSCRYYSAALLTLACKSAHASFRF